MKRKVLRKKKRARGWAGPSEAQRSQKYFISRGSPKAERRRLQENLRLLVVGGGETARKHSHGPMWLCGRCQLKKVVFLTSELML